MKRAVHTILATMMKESPKDATASPNDGSGGTAKQVYTSPSLTSSPNGNQSQHGSVSSKDSIASGSPDSNGLSPLSFHPIQPSYYGTPRPSVRNAHRVFPAGAPTFHNNQGAPRSPQRDATEGRYQHQQSPFALRDTKRILSYQENCLPQPMQYASVPPSHDHPYSQPFQHHPYPHPMMASSSDSSSYSNYPPPYPYPVHHSSFESHGSSGPAPYVAYSYAPPVIAYSHYPPWMPMPPKVDYVQDIKPEDVLCGRGGATNSHSGNRAFRLLVKRHQDRYLKAKKSDKPAVASHIVELIRERGGRFLRKCAETTAQGNVLWCDIGNDRAREKTCQALREGAPEIRRRKSKSFEETSSKQDDSSDEEDEPTSREQTTKVVLKERKSDENLVKSDTRDDCEDTRSKPAPAVQLNKEQATVRPSARFIKRLTTTEITMEELTPRERELYLRSFVPPDGTMHDYKKSRDVYRIARPYESVAENDEDASSMDHDDDDEWVENE